MGILILKFCSLQHNFSPKNVIEKHKSKNHIVYVCLCPPGETISKNKLNFIIIIIDILGNKIHLLINRNIFYKTIKNTNKLLLKRNKKKITFTSFCLETDNSLPIY